MNDWYKEILNRKILANEIANSIHDKQSLDNSNNVAIYECEYCHKQYSKGETQCKTCGGHIKLKIVDNKQKVPTFISKPIPKQNNTIGWIIIIALILGLIYFFFFTPPM